MDASHHSMKELFAQLGLPHDEASIDAFIDQHHPLPMTTRLYDAPFWTASQAALIREKLSEDGDWAVLIDTLNVRLRARPDTAAMALAGGEPARPS